MMRLKRKPAVAQLRDIAHARAGDKGDTSSVSVWAFDPAHFPAIKAALTAERMLREFPGLIRGGVEVYALDHLAGLNIVMHEALEGGVNGSLNLDGHGKSWSFLVLDLMIDLDPPAGGGGRRP
jgi:hypothetical protein